MLLWIDNPRTDPPWNLAAEEYLLTRSQDTIATLWRNSRSVIIGRNQELRGEVDMDFAERNGITVVRRLTGGGAVFHDLGNVNYSFICPDTTDNKLSFELFARPLIAALAGMGVTAKLSGRNDLLSGGFKISGCAHTLLGGRALYHGTLLFSADLSQMSGVLKVGADKYAGRGIKSVASRVANLNRWITGMTPGEFMSALRDRLIQELSPDNQVVESDFDQTAATDIGLLRDKKYACASWTDGADETLSALGRARDAGGGVQAWGEVSDGRLVRLRLTGDFMGLESPRTVESALEGLPYERGPLSAALDTVRFERALNGVSKDTILNALLGGA